MKYAFLFIGIAALLLSGPVLAKGMNKRRLDAEISAIANDRSAPLASISVLAIRHGKVVYQHQAGYRSMAGLLPANSHTLYRVASISKLVTSLAVMRLVEQGLLDLDADVSTVLGYVLRNPHFPAQPITLRQLLSHTSSLRDDAGYNFDDKVALRDVLLPDGAQYGKGEAWASDHGPGYFSYVNLNWGVIATLMERVTGERFDRLMQRLILSPMGLRGGYNPAEFAAQDVQDIATLYRKRIVREGQEIWQPEGPWIVQTDDYTQTPPAVRASAAYVPGTNGTLFGPHGSLRISAAGLGQIMLMLMQDGRLAGQQILQPASITAMFSEQWRNDGHDGNGYSERRSMNAFGLGNQHFLDIAGNRTGDRLVEDGGFIAKGHMGDAWGLTSAFVFDAQRKNGMIFLVGGPGFDPQTTPGKYSAKYRYEERILDSLYRGALPRVMTGHH